MSKGSGNESNFDGLGMGLSALSRLSSALSRSICPENFTGEPGKGGMSTDGTAKDCARDLGRGWKISPFFVIAPGEERLLADIAGPGAVQQMWFAVLGVSRLMILRIYWDGQSVPSVECPLGDFFACGWGLYSQISSLAVCVNPSYACNCYWEMPFRKHCRVTLQNIDTREIRTYYQINYTLTDIPEDRGYFHAQFRRSNPLPYKQVHTLVDQVQGVGQYVGTYLAWGVNNNGWWGEGEIKFFIDNDGEFPTICGTGTEDYFGGSSNFENAATKQYQEFSTPYSGLAQVIRPDGVYNSQTRFGMYRWHIMDPVRFQKRLRVTIQALGWRSGDRYLPLRDDIASVAYWYQTLPTIQFPKLPDRDALEVI
jgi:hypothetical protein